MVPFDSFEPAGVSHIKPLFQFTTTKSEKKTKTENVTQNHFIVIIHTRTHNVSSFQTIPLMLLLLVGDDVDDDDWNVFMDRYIFVARAILGKICIHCLISYFGWLLLLAIKANIHVCRSSMAWREAPSKKK